MFIFILSILLMFILCNTDFDICNCYLFIYFNFFLFLNFHLAILTFVFLLRVAYIFLVTDFCFGNNAKKNLTVQLYIFLNFGFCLKI